MEYFTREFVCELCGLEFDDEYLQPDIDGITCQYCWEEWEQEKKDEEAEYRRSVL